MRPLGKTTLLFGIGLAGLASAFATTTTAGTPAPGMPPTGADRVARGAYLVSAMGCNDCHTPFKDGPKGPEPDMSRALTGHPADLVMPPAPSLPRGPWTWSGAVTNTAFAGPWGVSFTANLTPDVETGLGAWTDVTTLRGVEFEVRTTRPRRVNADGELITATPAVFKVHPGAVTVFAPPA